MVASVAQKKPIVDIYTDGSSDYHTRKGGWAALLSGEGLQKEISGGACDTTNNRMELTAAIKALEALEYPCIVNLYTDSQYVVKGISYWIHDWIENGWQSYTGDPVKNQDLWERLHELRHIHKVRWNWIRGHDGNPGNEHVNELAQQAAG